MTELEEGWLDWSDSTQLALNCINSLQIAVLHSQALISGSNNVRICKFFDEDPCAQNSHHGVYKHFGCVTKMVDP